MAKPAARAEPHRRPGPIVDLLLRRIARGTVAPEIIDPAELNAAVPPRAWPAWTRHDPTDVVVLLDHLLWNVADTVRATWAIDDDDLEDRAMVRRWRALDDRRRTFSRAFWLEHERAIEAWEGWRRRLADGTREEPSGAGPRPDALPRRPWPLRRGTPTAPPPRPWSSAG